MKKLLANIFALVFCLSLMACSSDAATQTTELSHHPETTEPTVVNTTQEPTQITEKPTQATQPVITQPQQNMCYWCNEMPVGDFETYCVNCRCLKCDNLRKSGGEFLYCSKHNCNESWCEYPAFEDSQYCSEHKCSKPNCDNRRWSGSQYCAHHK